MNKVVLIGRLTDEPVIRTTQSDMTVANYRLAVDRQVKKDGQQNADFISCTTFGKTAEFAQKYLHKGMKIAVEGRIQTGSYTKDDGTKVYTTDVVVDRHEFCESRSFKDTVESENRQEASSSGFHDLPGYEDEGDLPF